MGAAPPISVLMPVRDGERFLAPALESILGQTGVAFELLVVEDGSLDGTPALLAAFAATHANLRVLAGEGRGLARALNLGLDQARGRYLARMDADDIALPGRLATQFQYLERHPQVGVLGTQALGIGLDGAPLGRVRVPVGPRAVRAALETSAALIHPTVMLRRDLALAVGGYRPLFDTAEDYDLWLRLLPLAQFDNLPGPFLEYRRHAGQQTSRRPLRQARLSALALICSRLRRAGLGDPLAGWTGLAGWRAALAALDPQAPTQVRYLTAGALADNGGSLSRRGGICFQAACRQAARDATPPIRQRLALACVRQQLRLLRARRWREAILRLPRDLLYWRAHLFMAYGRHASILWRARRGA